MTTATQPTLHSSVEQLRKARTNLYSKGQLLGQTGQHFDIWPSGLTADAGEFLKNVVAHERARRTLETGFAFGLSASFIIEGMLESGGEFVSHTSIDPFQRDSWDNSGLYTLRYLDLSRHATLIEQDSLLALPGLVAQGQVFDFGFVDGGHLFEHIFCDTLYMTRLVRPGGLIVLDDMWMPATKRALSYFTTNLGLIHENPSDTTPGRRFGVLRLPEKPVERAWDHFVPF